MIDIHYMEYEEGMFLLNKDGNFSQYSRPSYNILNGKGSLFSTLHYDIDQPLAKKHYKDNKGRLFLEHKFILWD